MTDYRVRRKVHPQGGSLLVALPRLWAEAKGLDRVGSEVDLVFNGIVRILPVEGASALETPRRKR